MSNNDNKKQKKGLFGWLGNASPLFYFVTGGYLCYLGYQLVKELLDTGEITVKWYFAAVGAVFIIVGLWAVLNGFKVHKLRKAQKEEEARALAEEEAAGIGYVADEIDGLGYIADDQEDGLGYVPCDEDDTEEAEPDDGESAEDEPAEDEE